VNQADGRITSVKTLADRVTAARVELNLSQAALATKAKVSPGTIGNIEAGSRKNPRELLAIARALKVEPEWLKSGKGPRYAGSDRSESAAPAPAAAAPAPPAPSPNFEDRHEVSDSDFTLLQAVKVATTDLEREAILRRHAELLAQARAQIEAAKK
jgi:transcriptional regulator with XRE-family HTH domain